MSISSTTSGPDVTGSGARLADATISTFVVLGASGDLANRLLMPALGKLLDAEPHRRGLVLLGAGAEAMGRTDLEGARPERRCKAPRCPARPLMRCCPPPPTSRPTSPRPRTCSG